MRIPKLPDVRFAAQHALAATFTSVALLSPIAPIANMPALAAEPAAVVQQASTSPKTWSVGNELKIPDPRVNGGRIFDGANILDAAAQKQISAEIKRIERDVAGSQIVVVTVGDVPASKTPKRTATELFNYFGIGSMQRENGVLVLIVQNARRVEIEVGLALENDFSNAWCTNMLEAQVVPSFKEARYGDGVLAGVEQIGERLRGGGGGYDVAATTGGGDDTFVLAIAALYFGGVVASNVNSDRESRKCQNCAAVVPESSIDEYRTIVKATNMQSGKRARSYTCEACGHTGEFTRVVPRYDNVRYDDSGQAVYYNNPSSSSSSSSSGGSSSGGGGGGASW